MVGPATVTAVIADHMGVHCREISAGWCTFVVITKFPSHCARGRRV